MDIRTWLANAKEKIPASDAELILLYILGEKDRTYLVSHDTRFLTDVEIEKANRYLEERISNRPLAYLVNNKEFYGRDFYVNEKVLIPRPETEDIIDLVKEIIQKNNLKSPSIYDIGTGSGCIAITLKQELPDAIIVAVDNSPEALEVARRNDETYGTKINFRNGNLLTGLEDDKIDIVVANLPYVDKKWDWLDLDALGYEPVSALFATDDGLAIIKELLDQIPKNETIKYVLLEADLGQHQEIINYAKQKGLDLVEARNFILYFVSL